MEVFSSWVLGWFATTIPWGLVKEDVAEIVEETAIYYTSTNDLSFWYKENV